MKTSGRTRERLVIHYEVTNPDGSIAKKGWFVGHSYLIQYTQLLLEMYQYTYNNNTITLSTTNVNDTSGVGRTPLQGSTVAGWNAVLATNAGAGVTTYGIVVGTGNTANVASQNALGAQIANGVTTGTLQYGTHGYFAVTSSGTNIWQWSISRVWVNGSGGTINVAEIGIYVATEDVATTERYFAIARDVPAAAIAVLNGQTLTITYKGQITVS